MIREGYVPVEKVAQYLCVTIHTIRAWVRSGQIPRSAYIKVGNTYRFSIEDVVAALTAKDDSTSTAQTEDPVQLELTIDGEKL